MSEYSIGMKSPVSSIFDLSPAEKLQLVEDLWDDLAATPEAVPVHDWQKQELARRKANLQNNPPRVSRGRLSGAESAAYMATRLILAPEVGHDMAGLTTGTKANALGWAKNSSVRETLVSTGSCAIRRLARLCFDSYRRALWYGVFRTSSFTNPQKGL